MKSTELVAFRLTSEENRQLKEAAKAAGTTVSKLARERVLQPATSPDLVLLLAELVSVRALLTGLFKAIAEGKPKGASEIEELVKKIDQEKLVRAQKKIDEWRKS